MAIVVIVSTCLIRVDYFDNSFIYHTIRGQKDLKIYGILLIIEIFDMCLQHISVTFLKMLYTKIEERQSVGDCLVDLVLVMLFLLLSSLNLLLSVLA